MAEIPEKLKQRKYYTHQLLIGGSSKIAGSQLIDKIQELCAEWEARPDQLYLELETIWDYNGECDVTAKFACQKLETDQEYLDRVQREKELKATVAKQARERRTKAKQQERALYERLKAKYEK